MIKHTTVLVYAHFNNNNGRDTTRATSVLDVTPHARVPANVRGHEEREEKNKREKKRNRKEYRMSRPFIRLTPRFLPFAGVSSFTIYKSVDIIDSIINTTRPLSFLRRADGIRLTRKTLRNSHCDLSNQRKRKKEEGETGKEKEEQ